MLNRETLGPTFRELRESRGVSQKDLAARAGITQPLISQIETGRYVPTLEALQTLLSLLDAELVIQLREE